ncbi:hypothetical protein J0910_06415 [Nocardiopsis sp. CNT-189]|uniref:hypothetical protein n=1 Tax=Nocardiopsis oceanisediminis TaxID=2816862 RepID=UPI003B2BB663
MWLAECPFPWDQGLVRPLVTRAGAVVLMCDSCSAVWCRPEDVGADPDGPHARERYSVPSAPGWETGCGADVRPGTVRWAREADVARAGWAGLRWHRDGTG